MARTVRPGDDIHATGFAFDIRRRYASGAQAEAFQYMLDRLQALNLIAWARDGGSSTSPRRARAQRRYCLDD